MVNKEMTVEDFNYFLPEELIAQTPLAERPSSRLLVLDKETGEVSHQSFRNVLDYLESGDCLVLNDTKVLPARLLGTNATGAAIEFLLLSQREGDPQNGDDIWEIIVRPGRKCTPGKVITFGDGLLSGEILEVLDNGNRIVKFSYEGIFNEVLDQLGEMPLPPYIHEKLSDRDRYQTVYARHEGSAAAPTAGLHFNEEFLEEIKAKGVSLAFVTLHVGLGTFRPVKVEKIRDHEMHHESYVVTPETAEIINKTKKNGKKVVCVGTTSTRVLESIADDNGYIKPCAGETGIFIYPGYKFRCLDALITNFHLPKSTLIMLVSALAGRENVLNAYNEAVQEKYRFFSFGDAMFIV